MTNTRRLALSAALLTSLAASAMAQRISIGDDSAQAAPADIRPPAPNEAEKPSLIVPYLLVFLLGGAAVGLSVLPSQRTHQD